MRFYFTEYETAENIMADHIGYLKGAMSKAQRYSNANNVVVVINDCATDDIVDFAYPDEQ